MTCAHTLKSKGLKFGLDVGRSHLTSGKGDCTMLVEHQVSNATELVEHSW